MSTIADKTVSGRPQSVAGPLSPDELRKLHAYWRAANYLSVGQIYLYDNPLLREPLKPEHVKRRLLGHWGTTPGLNFIYVHFNRLIKKHDLNVIYITGPGHGGPGLVANTYLNPVRDGAVLPVLHLNGYKIANPTVLGRLRDEELTALFTGYGYKPHFVEGNEPELMHQLMAATLDSALAEIKAIQNDARA